MQHITSFNLIKFTAIIFSFCAFNLCYADNLKEIYAQALLHDPTIKIAKATYMKEILALPAAKAGIMPTLSSSVSINGNYYGYKTIYNSNNYYNVNILSLNQTIFNYSTFSQLSLAEKQVKAAEIKYALAEQELILRVTKKYLAILRAEAGLNSATSKRKAYAKNIEQAKSKYAAGIAKNIDVLDAQAKYDSSISNEFLKQDNLDNAYAELQEIIGEQSFTINSLKNDIPLIQPTPLDEDSWANIALQNNLSIQYKKYILEAAKKNIAVADGAYLPALTASAGINYIKHTDATSMPYAIDSTGATTDGITASGSLTLTIPLYSGNNSVNSRSAVADYSVAQKELDKQYRAINRTTRQAYKGILTAISRINAMQTAINSAENANQANAAAFDLGRITIAELLTQEANLYTAKQNYLEAKYDYIENIITLEQASNNLNISTIDKINAWFN